MQYLIEIDLRNADVGAFDEYEVAALRVFEEHGGAVLARVRDEESLREWHLLDLADAGVWDAFQNDPRRLELGWLLARARVTATRHQVHTVG